MKKLVLLVAVISALFMFPSLASAGCQAEAGGTAYKAGSGGNTDYHDGAAAIGCTTSNGSWYQLREYFQTNETGVYTISTNPITFVFGCSNCAPLPSNYHVANHFIWYCGNLAGPPWPTGIRVKAVLENMITHTTDVAYGVARSWTTACN